MAWSTPDISTITQALYNMLTAAFNASFALPPPSIQQFTVNINCASPETARTDAPCQLSLYLLHVGRDPFWRNTPVSGPRPQLNAAQPLSLNLYYLLTAWAGADFTSEQQAMSIALQCFHSQPIYRPSGTNDEFTISIEADTIEEMSRLWQAFNTPIRLSCLVKVGVVFIAPALPTAPIKPPPVTANLAVGPTVGGGPLLFAGDNLAFSPWPLPADGGAVSVSVGAPVVVGGATLTLAGAGLDLPTAGQVFVSTPNGATEWRLNPTWRQNATAPGQLDLTLPTTYAASPPPAPGPPTKTLPAGPYLVSVGRNTPTPKVRSNAVPVVIAARIDGLTGPDGSGLYTLAGAGFASGATTLAVGATALAAAGASPPGAGTFFVDPAGASITFALPSPGPPTGTYAVSVVVNGVPCLPGWLVTTP
jgi:hypothetical protein